VQPAPPTRGAGIQFTPGLANEMLRELAPYDKGILNRLVLFVHYESIVFRSTLIRSSLIFGWQSNL